MTSIRAQRVVVGVDETDESMAALAFGMREAAVRGIALDVVTAWTLVDGDHSALGDDVRHDELPERARRHAQQVQDRAVALTLQEVDVRPLLSRQVLEGEPGKVLVRVAREADYLVVGTPAGGRIWLGSHSSVSDYCLRHATCAVVVVQTPERSATAQEKEGARDASRQRSTSGSPS